jgi:tRNA_anti-like
LICRPPTAGSQKMWWLGDGQKVKVTGMVYDISSVAIDLDRCTIEEQGANPTETVTAEDFTASFTKNETAAKKKYINAKGFKEIIVEGTVADIGPGANSNFFKVKLAGKDGLAVLCTGSEDTLNGLKKGDKVTIKGYIIEFNKDEKHVLVNTAFLLKKW